MQPKADMVPSECGFNQSKTASCLCARVAYSFPCSPAMARDGELTQTQYSNSSYVTTKAYETSACGCTNNTIFHNELFSRFLPSPYVAWQRISLGESRKMATLMNFSFFVFKISLLRNFPCQLLCMYILYSYKKHVQ